MLRWAWFPQCRPDLGFHPFTVYSHDERTYQDAVSFALDADTEISAGEDAWGW